MWPGERRLRSPPAKQHLSVPVHGAQRCDAVHRRRQSQGKDRFNLFRDDKECLHIKEHKDYLIEIKNTETVKMPKNWVEISGCQETSVPFSHPNRDEAPPECNQYKECHRMACNRAYPSFLSREGVAIGGQSRPRKHSIQPIQGVVFQSSEVRCPDRDWDVPKAHKIKYGEPEFPLTNPTSLVSVTMSLQSLCRTGLKNGSHICVSGKY
ncbi:hypothetical protein BC936DRAFT_137522 [Jimgerdemannia flammicorona]|uniref:Uncharacterized protein n=1 Tax=Jimgerdemannia flammicorona TaxID=994334 RepID=A0A433CX55_9FUNG|nr:hypothetical protein BC936DRAFT_137522 [Jimgerdemannia flammicorona]